MKKRVFGKLGVICLALAVALAVTGIGYGAWVSAVDVNGVVFTAVMDADMVAGTASPAGISSWANPTFTQPVLCIQFVNAPGGLPPNGNYTANFTVINPLITGVGKVPVKVESIVISSVAGLPAGSTVGVTGIAVGDQIDPGGNHQGAVNVHLGGNVAGFSFTVTVNVKQWNQ